MEEEESVSRREFIKRAFLIGAGIAVGAYGISRILDMPSKDISSETNSTTPWKWSKEGYYYIKLGDNVKCQVCPNQCIIREGGRSVCRNKTNYNGELYTLAYGNPCAVHIDPIEKKPLFHFLPTSSALSIATAGCNLRCLNCQNWQISQKRPEETSNGELFPQQVVEVAQRENCQSIAYTYSEPTAWYEYMYDTAKIASDHHIKNIWITNGYMNEEPLRDLCQYLDAANVDLKSFSNNIYHKLNSGTLDPVLNTLKVLKEEGVWFEVTNLVVPTWTDDLNMIEDMCQWLYENVGPGYPLHFSRFHPDYKLQNLPPTPVKTLQNARQIGLDVGLQYVYVGNVPGAQEEDTYCPECNTLIVERKGFVVCDMHITDGRCEYCGYKIEGVWS